MKAVKQLITGLTAISVVAEHAAWSSVTTYSAQDYVLKGSRHYMSVIDSNLNIDPEENTGKWLLWEVANQFAAIDLQAETTSICNAASRDVSYDIRDHNLASNPEVISASTGTQVTADNVVAPDGTSTADLLRETAVTSEHYADDESVAITSGETYTYSVYINFVGGTERSFYHRVAGDAIAFVKYTVSTDTFYGSGGSDLVSYSRELLDDGWVRLFITYLAPITGTAINRVQLVKTDGTVSYLGTPTAGFGVWGRQVEKQEFGTEYFPVSAVYNLAMKFDVENMETVVIGNAAGSKLIVNEFDTSGVLLNQVVKSIDETIENPSLNYAHTISDLVTDMEVIVLELSNEDYSFLGYLVGGVDISLGHTIYNPSLELAGSVTVIDDPSGIKELDIVEGQNLVDVDIVFQSTDALKIIKKVRSLQYVPCAYVLDETTDSIYENIPILGYLPGDGFTVVLKNPTKTFASIEIRELS